MKCANVFTRNTWEIHYGKFIIAPTSGSISKIIIGYSCSHTNGMIISMEQWN